MSAKYQKARYMQKHELQAYMPKICGYMHLYANAYKSGPY